MLSFRGHLLQGNSTNHWSTALRVFDGKICPVLSKSMSGLSKDGFLAKWLHLCFLFALDLNSRHLNGATAGKTIGRVWLSFLWILLSLICHSYKQLLIATDREGSPVCRDCKQQGQHGVLNETSSPGLTNGMAVWLPQLLRPQYFTSSVSNGLVQARQMSMAPTGQGLLPPLLLEWPSSSFHLAPRSMQTQSSLFFWTSPFFSFFLSVGILSHLVVSVAVKCEGWGWEDECYQRGLSCSWSRQKSCRWLAACLKSNMARGKRSAPERWDNCDFWVESHTICGFLSSVWVILLMYWKNKRRTFVLAFRCCDVSPV